MGMSDDVVAPFSVHLHGLVPVGRCGIRTGGRRERAPTFTKRSAKKYERGPRHSRLSYGPMGRSETGRSPRRSLGYDNRWFASRRVCGDTCCFDSA